MAKRGTAEVLGEMLRSAGEISLPAKVMLVLAMAFPAMCAQVTHVAMQYIDASMVGRLGPNESAAIGLVSPSVWLIMGLGMAVTVGYTVQIAQYIGAGKLFRARSAMGLGFLTVICLSATLSALSALGAGALPGLLGGTEAINGLASSYFFVMMLGYPLILCNVYASNVLQATGNIKTPSVLNIAACFLDVLFNFIFIFPSRHVEVMGLGLDLPGFGLGVRGAALGTVMAESTVLVVMLWCLLVRSKPLHLRREKLVISGAIFRRGLRISFPVALDHVATTGAMVASIVIVSGLGIASIAAHSFSITAESFCYMIIYGTAHAAAAIIGQAIGARRKDLAWNFTLIITGVGVLLVTVCGVIMYTAAPILIGLLSPDPEIRRLGAMVLRVEAFAEPLYGASILIAGCLRGAGDTFVPGMLNIGTMWLIRIPLSIALARPLGLYGVWVAMAFELCVRGIVFLLRLRGRKWLGASDRKTKPPAAAARDQTRGQAYDGHKHPR